MSEKLLPSVTLEMVAAGEEVFRERFARSCRGAAPAKAVCEANAIAIYSAMWHANHRPSTLSDSGLERDNCEICKGANGGVPGNENVISGVVVCDYCDAAIRPILAALSPKVEPTEALIEAATRAFYEKAAGIGEQRNGIRYAPGYDGIDKEEREQLKQCVRAALQSASPNGDGGK